MTDSELSRRIEAVRRFNRTYTRQVGLLQESYLRSQMPLAAVRVVYELAHRGTATASELCADLGLGSGYLSRLLRDIRAQGLVNTERSESDGRRNVLSLSEKGCDTFAMFNARSREEIGNWLGAIPESDQVRLVRAMTEMENILGAPTRPGVPYILRPHRAGDMGWVVHRHGALYAREYGFDLRFEALVAEVVASFIRNFDASRECCWIAEMEGVVVGSAFVVRMDDSTAKLRLVLVEPSARGLGIGKRLVEECARFARHCGYTKMVLWTNDVLIAARRLYQQAGYRLVAEEPHQDFGPPMVGETWELDL